MMKCSWQEFRKSLKSWPSPLDFANPTDFILIQPLSPLDFSPFLHHLSFLKLNEVGIKSLSHVSPHHCPWHFPCYIPLIVGEQIWKRWLLRFLPILRVEDSLSNVLRSREIFRSQLQKLAKIYSTQPWIHLEKFWIASLFYILWDPQLELPTAFSWFLNWIRPLSQFKIWEKPPRGCQPNHLTNSREQPWLERREGQTWRLPSLTTYPWWCMDLETWAWSTILSLNQA